MEGLSFPVLAGEALTQGFAFLYGQLSALLERRRDHRTVANVGDALVAEVADVLDGKLAPLQADGAKLADRAAELELLRDLLSQYAGERVLDGEDRQLRLLLGRLREALEDVFGQHITFQGENRAASGPRIRQDIDHAHGESVGLEIGRARGKVTGEIEQTVRTANEGSKIVGVRIDDWDNP